MIPFYINGDFHLSNDDAPGTFSYFGKVQWNSLPDKLRSIESIDLFKAKLKQLFMDKY